jgi:hypothetical protein
MYSRFTQGSGAVRRQIKSASCRSRQMCILQSIEGEGEYHKEFEESLAFQRPVIR